MTPWNFCAWVGILTLAVLALRISHFAVETFIVVRVGWDDLEELGFWRAIPAAISGRTQKGNPLL